MICRCCGQTRREKCRNLCWSCYYRPGIRERFQPRINLGVRDHYGGHELADFPTRAYPGQPEKVDVMAHRARQGKALFHPGDRRVRDEELTPVQRGPTPSAEEVDE